jgi:hypothetical protein
MIGGAVSAGAFPEAYFELLESPEVFFDLF